MKKRKPKRAKHEVREVIPAENSIRPIDPVTGEPIALISRERALEWYHNQAMHAVYRD